MIYLLEAHKDGKGCRAISSTRIDDTEIRLNHWHLLRTPIYSFLYALEQNEENIKTRFRMPSNYKYYCSPAVPKIR